MPKILTTNATIMCPHGGRGNSMSSNPKWTIDGGTVLVEGDKGTIAGCLSLAGPCMSYTLKSMGFNSTLIDGKPVILVTDFNQTSAGVPLTTISERHKVFDETPPSKQPAPTKVALADTNKPTVVAAPPTWIYNSKTPATAGIPGIITFTLTTLWPSKWILTVMNGLTKQGSDLTYGSPLGATIVPPLGGQWLSPVLTLVLTLTPPYMMALGSGLHSIGITGVSQRGLSGYAETILTVI